MLYRIINTFSLNAQMRVTLSMHYLKTLKERPRFWRLKGGTKLKEANFVSCYHELLQGLGIYENPQENQVGVICIRSPTASREKGERS
jgi:hypothetical protein